MTTITVVKKNGYAAIAADTLTKYGYRKESADYVVNHEKIMKVGDSYVGIAGSVTTDHAMRVFFASKGGAKARLGSVLEIFKTWNELHRALREDFFLNTNESGESSYEPTKIDSLIAGPRGIFGVSSYRSVQEFTKFYSYGSGNDFANGAMFAVYGDADKSAEEVARLGVEAAIEFDEDSGPPITSYAIKLRRG